MTKAGCVRFEKVNVCWVTVAIEPLALAEQIEHFE